MLIIVLSLNGLIALGCLYGVWRVVKLRRSLSRAADALTTAEQICHRVLHNAPEAIMQGQLGSYELRQYYRQLKPQLRQAQQILALFGMGQAIWRRRSPFRRRSGSGNRKRL
ncbi:MAG TPA: hypothetical protein V6C78_06070 [Crinalium sp.]|jgi:hypothetical protein